LFFFRGGAPCTLIHSLTHLTTDSTDVPRHDESAERLGAVKQLDKASDGGGSSSTSEDDRHVGVTAGIVVAVLTALMFVSASVAASAVLLRRRRRHLRQLTAADTGQCLVSELDVDWINSVVAPGAPRQGSSFPDRLR